jgi:hypothetical protein
MIKALNKVNTMERETTIFSKGKPPFIHKLGYHTQRYIRGYMPFVQVVKMKPAYQKQNGHENLVLMPWVTSEITSYQATWYPNSDKTKSSSMPNMASTSWWLIGLGGFCT